MLSKTTRIAIEAALNDGYFRAEDFTIDEHPGTKETTVILSYKYDSGCFCNIELHAAERVFGATPAFTAMASDERPLISGTMTSGELTCPAPFSAKNQSGLVRAIATWLRIMKQETAAEPQWRSLNAWRAALDEKLQELLSEDLEPGPLSEAELEALKARLDGIEAKLKEQLSEAIKDQTELKRRVDELHATVEFLKDQGGKLDRTTLREALLTRLYGWVSREENVKLLKNGSDLLILVADAAKNIF